MVSKQRRKFDKKAIIGLVLLIAAFLVGAVLNKATRLTSTEPRSFPVCDDSISVVCIPTAYISISLGFLGDFVINVTSAAVSAVLFVLGVILVRE